MGEKISRDNFQAFLQKNNLKQKTIAEFLGVSSPFITQILNGSRDMPADKAALLLSSEDWDLSMFAAQLNNNGIIANEIRDNATANVAPSSDLVRTTEKALDEISRMNERFNARLAKAQEQIDRLLSLLERPGNN